MGKPTLAKAMDSKRNPVNRSYCHRFAVQGIVVVTTVVVFLSLSPSLKPPSHTNLKVLGERDPAENTLVSKPLSNGKLSQFRSKKMSVDETDDVQIEPNVTNGKQHKSNTTLETIVPAKINHGHEKNATKKRTKSGMEIADDALVDSGARNNDSPSDDEVDSERNSDIPSWSKFPRTQFTDQVLGIIADLSIDGDTNKCNANQRLTVKRPYTKPRIRCDNGSPQHCTVMKQIFRKRVLPYNVSVGFKLTDYTDFHPKLEGKVCFLNSSPGGKLCMPNMQDISAMDQFSHLHDKGPEQYRWPYRDDVPWKRRNSLPIFRGTAWLPEIEHELLCRDPDLTYKQIMEGFPRRFRAVDFSVDHPDLLDARFSKADKNLPCMEHNATNGLSKLLPIDPIDKDDYFSNYHVALVVKGIGAAFCLSNHLMTRTAVLLQDCECEEWYTPYMKPCIHYIPVSEDLGDLGYALKWVRRHPQKVRVNAENGRDFYDKYLTFHHHEEHIYELVYRLSEHKHFKKSGTQENE